MTTMIGMVEAGLGGAAGAVAAMPAHDHPLLVSVPLEEPAVMRQVGLIRRRGRSLSPTPSAQQLYDFLIDMEPTTTFGGRRKLPTVQRT